MKLVRWEFNSLQLPMIEDDEQELYCTSAALCKALGITAGQLRDVYQRHRTELFPLSVAQRDAKQVAASAAGSTLNAHKASRHLRLV